VLSDTIEIMNRMMVLAARLFPWLMGFYIILMFAFTLSGADDLSYYDDEMIHLAKIQLFLDHGYYALSGGENAAGELLGTRGHLYAYGPLFTLTAHLVTVMAGLESWGTIGFTDASFVVRHIMVSVFSFVGVIAAGWAIAIVTKSLRWGLATSSVLVSIPIWTGSAMFNLKDTPAATGFTLLTAGCIALTLPADRLTRGMRAAGWLTTFAGSLLIWGVRPGLWPALVLTFLAMLLIRARMNNFSQWKKVFTEMVFPASAVIASYVAMMAIYPKIFLDPLRFVYRSFSETSTFNHDTMVLTNGVALGVPPPWYYFPQWLSAQLPEVLVVLLVISIGVAVGLVLRRLFQSATSQQDFVFPAMVYVFIQFAAFPVAAIVLQSPVYHGIRQFLFMIPGVAMLVMLSLFVLVRNDAVRKIRGLWPTVAGLMVASTIVTTATQVQMFPYSVSYFNPTTVAGGIDERWDVYARKLAVGELYAQLTAEQRLRCTKNCPSVDSIPQRFAEPATTESEPLRYWEFIRFPHNVASLKSGNMCPTTIHAVARPYFTASISILEANVCEIKGASLVPATPAGDDTAKQWKRLTQWGWEKERPDGVTTLPGVPSALAWTVTTGSLEAAPTYALDLSVLPGSAEVVTLSATINGVALDDVVLAAGDSRQFVFEAPTPTVQGAPVDLVVVEFVLSDSNGSPVTNTLAIKAIRPFF
jgi:hypothetical protein